MIKLPPIKALPLPAVPLSAAPVKAVPMLINWLLISVFLGTQISATPVQAQSAPAVKLIPTSEAKKTGKAKAKTPAATPLVVAATPATKPVSAKTKPADAKAAPADPEANKAVDKKVVEGEVQTSNQPPAHPPTAPETPSASALSAEDAVERLEEYSSNKNYLALRIGLQKARHSGLSLAQWLEVRRLLHQHPFVGWDAWRFWEKLGFLLKGQRWSKLDRLVVRADRLMTLKRFPQAFDFYQRAAQHIKKQDGGSDLNSFLYYQVLHSMARSLYGAKRFDEAFKVYSWIPIIYPNYKQVLFERTWAAFRAGKISQANGSIAAQYSSYFDGFIEPETFLMQIYIYRKLCRNEELQLVLEQANDLRARFRDPGLTVETWAASNFETAPYVHLLKQKAKGPDKWISTEEMAREQEIIRAWLQTRFKETQQSVLEDLEKVLAYAQMAFSSTSRELPPIDKLPSQEDLLKSRLEMWPISDAEDWLDELGHQTFVGESECKEDGSS